MISGTLASNMWMLTRNSYVGGRRHLKLHAHKRVFELLPGIGSGSIEDARETFELCKTMTDWRQKDAYYCMFGLNRHNVEKYLAKVEELERSYRVMVEAEEKERSFRIQIGPIIIYICWAIQSRKSSHGS